MNILINVPTQFHGITTVVFCVFLLSAVINDMSSNRIPNSLVLLVLLTGLADQLGTDLYVGVVWWLAGLAVGLAFFLPFYAGGGMGAGDVKMMAAIAGFLGPQDALIAVAATLIAGVPLALAYMVSGYLKRLHSTAQPVTAGAGRVGHNKSMKQTVSRKARNDEQQRIPYALAIAAGTFFALWWTGRYNLVAGVINP